MKKFIFAFIFAISMSFGMGSCGNKTTANAGSHDSDTTIVDSLDSTVDSVAVDSTVTHK
jgi:hypothetical protein